MEKPSSTKQSVRIQTSVLNGVEKKALLWLAERQPKWADSDMLTFIGFIGAVVIATGYILSNCNVHFLWLASLGFIINWYGDSLDGTLARYRKQQRPLVMVYIDGPIKIFGPRARLIVSPQFHLAPPTKGMNSDYINEQTEVLQQKMKALMEELIKQL